MRARPRGGKIYYLLDLGGKPRKEIPRAADDYVAAVKKWPDLTMSEVPAEAAITFRHATERHQQKVLPTKALTNQDNNLPEIAKLYEFFDVPPVALDDIDPMHIHQYLDWRVRTTVEAAHAKNEDRRQRGKKLLKVPPNLGHVVENREKALFSHI